MSKNDYKMSKGEKCIGPPKVCFESSSSSVSLSDINKTTGPSLIKIRAKEAKEKMERFTAREERRLQIMVDNQNLKQKEDKRYARDPDYHSKKKNSMGPLARKYDNVKLPPITKPKNGPPKTKPKNSSR